MDFVFDVPIAKNTGKGAPASLTLRVPKGWIKQVRAFFPAGCVGLVGIRALVDGIPVYPSNPESWYRGDNLNIVFTDNLELDQPFQTLEVQGYNDDDTFAHTPSMGFTILAAEERPSVWWLQSLGFQGEVE